MSNLEYLVYVTAVAREPLACSQTLYFLFKVRQVQVIKYKPQGIYWLSVQRSSGGGRRK